ncbi:hypothetical protein HK14_03525 [Acetobacter cibinongensis]|uniref:Cytochrome c domain-containing protein n=2 Tax=Acetobacter cibinongensis TaxID=146475 RepID=A0A1Z5YVY4_9PROT|nr:hypothetical protein HK14_03525 [Acetobacter cibinongensis]
MIRQSYMRKALLLGGLMLMSPFSARAEEGMTRAEVFRQVEALSALGDSLFHDPSLSASGKQSCASCHDEAHAFAPANGLAVQKGGATLQATGHRATPSLKYLQAVPQFTEHFFDSEDEADESIDNGPTGGLTWDGRANTLAEQAAIPLLAPFEMGNKTQAEVVAKAIKAGYEQKLRAFQPFLKTTSLFVVLTKALETYQQSWKVFYPYTSKYDAYLAGKVALSPEEQLGLKLFEDPDKGNCASCHISQPGHDGTPPQFTDYGMIALAVPRNMELEETRSASSYDLGLCGPDRQDLHNRPEYCGLFRTPTLRNVATRKVFFHNGFYKTLHDAVAFYVLRDTHPERVYPTDRHGTVIRYNDLPTQYQANINKDPPFGERTDNKPALSEPEIDAIVAFLQTLTDGYTQSHP